MANDPFSSTPPPPVAGDPSAVLASYERSVTGLRAAIVDLEASPSYLMLTGGDLGPVTAGKVGEAAARAERVWPALEAAAAAVEHVRQVVDEGGLRRGGGREVRDLLTERWVEMPSSMGLPTAERASIGELLDRVRRGYDELGPLVSEVESLWQAVLPRIDAARTTLARLGGEMDALGLPEPLITRAQALADDLADRLVTDPLAVVQGDGDQLDEAVAAAAKQVASLLTSHASLDADLAGTEEQLARLRLLRNRAAAAGDRARAKIADPEGLVRVPSSSVLDGPKGLGERLDDLLAAGSDAAWNQRRSLLDRWLGTAGQLERQLERALDANQAPLDGRDELRGRLTAYQAKIAAVGRAEDLALTDLVDVARQELYTAPTDLAVAAATIDDLAGRLRS
ncbi:MAG: hypothetical protein AAF962_18100 [Actinomycetota bacterium]